MENNSKEQISKDEKSKNKNDKTNEILSTIISQLDIVQRSLILLDNRISSVEQ